MNAAKTLGALANMPFIGATYDEEPAPLGEVVDVKDAPLVAKRLQVRLADRRAGDVKGVTLVVVYADHVPVITEIEAMGEIDASDNESDQQRQG